MAKKKKTKKPARKAARKAVPRKKTASKKTSGKKGQKTRKAVRKAPRKSAAKATRKKTTAPKNNADMVAPCPGPGPRVEIWPYSDDPPSCDIQPHGRVRAPRKRDLGYVNFYNHGNGMCTIHFSNYKVFNTTQAFLAVGDNCIKVEADPGDGDHEMTNVSIDGCEDEERRILNGPTDIIVP